MRHRPHNMFIRSFDFLEVVPSDFVESLWLYMCYGIEPGGFGMAVLCNDFMAASLKAHRSLPTGTFTGLAQWLTFMAPIESYGSMAAVEYWKSLTDDERRDIMIERKLRPSVMQVLTGEEVA